MGFRYRAAYADVLGMWIEPAKPTHATAETLQDLNEALAWCGCRIARDLDQDAARAGVSPDVTAHD